MKTLSIFVVGLFTFMIGMNILVSNDLLVGIIVASLGLVGVIYFFIKESKSNTPSKDKG